MSSDAAINWGPRRARQKASDGEYSEFHGGIRVAGGWSEEKKAGRPDHCVLGEVTGGMRVLRCVLGQGNGVGQRGVLRGGWLEMSGRRSRR